jgi:hypothetical protein
MITVPLPKHCLLLLCLALPALAESRAWKDATGRVIQAEFVSATTEAVIIRRDGKDFTLPLAKLSAEDQAWVLAKTKAPAPAQPAASGAVSLGGVPVQLGAKMEFEVPLSETLLAKLKSRMKGVTEPYTDVDMTRAAVGLFLPKEFDASKPWPIMIVSVTNSGRDNGKFPSSVKSMGAFMDAARDLGWIVIAADCPGNLSPGVPFNRCALAEAALEAMAVAWPASKSWPVATGGFSGGAKYSGWLGGWFTDAGRTVTGMFMGGCNEDMASKALKEKELKIPKKALTAAKVFLSSGAEDKIAGPQSAEKVAVSLKGSGFDLVKVETFAGGHELNREHVLAAMKWFRES